MKTAPPLRRRHVLDANPDDAPGCVAVYCPADPSQNQLIQTDWDWPPTARLFGWNMRARGERCEHRGTDGTVDCPDCKRTAGSFIRAAREFIDNNDGKGILI